MEELKPCPFCGESNSYTFEMPQTTKWGVVMCSCGACGPDVRTDYDFSENATWHKAAILNWNARIEPEKPSLLEAKSFKDLKNLQIMLHETAICAEKEEVREAFAYCSEQLEAHIEAIEKELKDK